MALPYKAYEEAADRTKAFLTVEMSMGQMIEDVKLGVNGRNRCISAEGPAE